MKGLGSTVSAGEVLSREVGTTEIERNQKKVQKGWYRI